MVVRKDSFGEDEVKVKEKFSAIDNIIYISAQHHTHLETLRERMVVIVLTGILETEDTVVTNARNYHALKEVQRSLDVIKAGLDKNLPGACTRYSKMSSLPGRDHRRDQQ